MTTILIQMLLPHILEIAGTLVMTALSALLLKLREKQGIAVTEGLKNQLHAAIMGAVKDMIVRYVATGGSLKDLNVGTIVKRAAEQVVEKNPALVKKVKTATIENLEDVAARHVPGAVRDIFGPVDYSQMASTLGPVAKP